MARRNEYIRQWKQRDRVANPEKYRAIWQAERVKYREQRIASMKAWRAKNPEKVKEANAKRPLTGRRCGPPKRFTDEERREHRLAYSRRYAREHPDVRLAMVIRRRARKLGLTEHHTNTEWYELLRLYENACVYCGQSDVRLTRDHAIPLVRGGSDRISNIVPSLHVVQPAQAHTNAVRIRGAT